MQSAGHAHGGLLATLADIALGNGSGHGIADRPILTTAGLTIELLGQAIPIVRYRIWTEPPSSIRTSG